MSQTFRTPQIDLAAILSDQHPSIDLRTESFDNSSRNFLKALTSYKNRAITTLSERRKHQAQEKKKVVERTQAVEVEIGQCKLKEIDLVARELVCRPPLDWIAEIFRWCATELEREKEERKDAELTVAGLKRQHASLRDKIATVDADIEQYRALAQNLRRGTLLLSLPDILWLDFVYPKFCSVPTEKNQEISTLNTFASHVSPEVQLCERRLVSTIEGVGKDRLLVRFSSIDPTDPDREATFVLDISAQNYKGPLPS
jgi:kinetochore protein Spc25